LKKTDHLFSEASITMINVNQNLRIKNDFEMQTCCSLCLNSFENVNRKIVKMSSHI